MKQKHIFKTILTLLLMIAALQARSWAQVPSSIGSINYDNALGAYRIATANNLRDLSVYVNGEGFYSTGGFPVSPHDCSGMIFKQTANIVCNDTIRAIGTYGNGYEMGANDVTNTWRPFKGTYDGQGYVIEGLKVKNDKYYRSVNGAFFCAGLFGATDDGAVLRNIRLVNPSINNVISLEDVYDATSRNSGEAKNSRIPVGYWWSSFNRIGYYMAGIVGDAKGSTVEDCYVYNPRYSLAYDDSVFYTAEAQYFDFPTIWDDICAHNRLETSTITRNYNVYYVRCGYYVDFNGDVASDAGFAYSSGRYYRPGSSVAISYSRPTPDGYSLSFTDGNNLTLSHSGSSPNYTVTSRDFDIRITPTYTPITYHITYNNVEGATFTTENPTSYNIETETFTLNRPRREGYTFLGWTGTELARVTQEVTINRGTFGDRSYTAQWVEGEDPIFDVTNSGSTFTITRDVTSTQQTVYYRTVSLSAIAGQHFTQRSGTLTFEVGESSKSITVTETTPNADAYKYQTSNSRSYRFEVLDEGGFELAHKDRTITSGLTQFSAAKVSKSISNLVKLSNGSSFSSDMSSSKYMDVSFSIPSGWLHSGGVLDGYVLIDDSYDYANYPATVSTSTLINSTGAPAAYLNSLGYKIYATVCFTAQERDDGYQYIQILAGTSSSSYDTGADPNGEVNNPSNSIYKVCYELSDGSDQGQGKAYFPHRGTTSSEFSLSDGKLWQQKYKSSDYNGSGAVILPVSTSYITTRFDAGGDNDDTWGYKDFKVRMALCDAVAPTRSGNPVVNPGPHANGNVAYVSVPFSEMVTVSGTPTLNTSWGNLKYVAGSGTNVLTFADTINAPVGTRLLVNYYSGTIKDLAGNSFNGSISYGFALADTVTGTHDYTITYTLKGGTATPANPTTYNYTTESFTLTNPTRTGYDFNGWTGSDLTEASMNVTVATHSHGDRRFIANWTPHTFVVVFNKNHNDATGSMDDMDFTYDEAQTLVANVFTRTGYSFGGWSTTPDGDIAYTDGQSVSNLTATDGATVTLYAQWTPITYTVRFNANNSEGTMDDMTFTYDEAQALAANAFTRTGYSFVGWSTTSDGDIVYTDGQSVSNLTATDGDIVTLYAQWAVIPWSGSGNSDSPYIITYASQLVKIADDVNSGTNNYNGKYFKLGNDIDMSSVVEYMPIGNGINLYTHYFRGNFDGDNHTVSNLTVNRPDSQFNGLFGRVYYGTVSNLVIDNATVSGSTYTACLVGNIENGTVSNCIVKNSTVTAVSYNSGIVVGEITYGYGNSASNYYYNCSRSYNNATATVNIGVNSADCDWARSVHSLSLQAHVTASSAETVDIDDETYYASNVPVTLNYTDLPECFVVSYSYNDGSDHAVEGDSFVMPAADITVSATITPDLATWWHADEDHDGTTEERAYIITTTTGLNLLSTLVNGIEGYPGNDFRSKYFKLGNDIVYSHTTDWDDATSTENNYKAIGTFSGTFDGQGYIVSGIRIYGGNNYDSYLGFFGYLNGGTVKNVTLSDVRITGYQFIGGIVGMNENGTIENCHVADNVGIHAISDIAGMHGGIVGNCAGTVDGCTSGATITADDYRNCGGYGGIAGVIFSGNIQNCFAVGAKIDNNSGGGAIVGGVVDGTLGSNYYNACIVNDSTSNIGCGSSPEGDITDNDGALPVYRITLGEHITTTPEAAVTWNNIGYYKEGTVVTPNAEGYILIGSYAVKDAQNNNITAWNDKFTMPACNVTVSANLVESPWRGSGAEEDPFIISTPEDLVALSDYTKRGYTNWKCFLMVNDIDMSSVENFTPIGNTIGSAYHPFSGSFNGNNHTIKHLAIDNVECEEIGLFGNMNDGRVSGVILDSATIRGLRKVGGIAGLVSSSGLASLTSCRVENSSFYTEENPSVGAICYDNYCGDHGIMRDNYYYNCSVNGSPAPTGIGTGDGDKYRYEKEFAMPITDISIEVKAGQWHAIASPFVKEDNFFFSTDLTEGVYDLLYYFEPSAIWVNCKNEGEPAFVNGVGYIYRTATTGTRRMQGVLQRVLPEYASLGTYAYNGDAAFKGFNLLGNPYDIPICLQDASDFSENVDGYYTLSPDGCWQTHLLSDTIAAGQAFLVQVNSGSDLYIPVPTEESKSGRVTVGQVGLRFEVSDGEHSDVAYVLTEKTEGNRNSDGSDNSVRGGLRKFGHMNEGLPSLSIVNGDGRYAIATLDDDATSFDLTFGGKAGSYTLTVSGISGNSGYLHLLDRATGKDIDLLRQPTYTFTQSRNHAISNRFIVKLSPNAAQSTQPAHFARQDGENLIIEGTGLLQIYDAMGRQIKCVNVGTRECVSNDAPATNAITQLRNYAITQLHISIFPCAGVYVLRLGEKSQKIVIR